MSIKPIQTKPEPACPECGVKMRLRRPKPGHSHFEAFWGCPNYPDCHATRDIGDDGKPIIDEEDAI